MTDTDTKPKLDLYKKYRPRKWSDVVGQDHVVNPLKSLIVRNEVPAILGLFGPAGCGKTTIAKLLAKSINCPERSAKDPDPCNECDTCLGIDNGTQLGYNYESMASDNGKVEGIRRIIKMSQQIQPIKQQVWVLDEVHNITPQGLDSLLIPFESETIESMFLLCSTNPKKIGKTILSRISQRHLHSVDAKTLKGLLTRIADAEGLEYDDELLRAAIIAGAGSARDTIMNFQTLHASEGVGASKTPAILEAFAEGDAGQALRAVVQAIQEGSTATDVAEDIASGLRNLLLAISGAPGTEYGIIPAEDPKAIARGLLGHKGIIFVIDEMGNALTNMSRGIDERLALDLSIIKVCEKIRRVKGAKKE